MAAKRISLHLEPDISEVMTVHRNQATENLNELLVRRFMAWLERGIFTLAPGQHIRTALFNGSWIGDTDAESPSEGDMPEALTFTVKYYAAKGRKTLGPFTDEHNIDMRSLAMTSQVTMYRPE